MKTYSNFLFSLAVTAVMNALDMIYHLATGWAVHLNYVAIKLTVIFLATFMITQFIGIGKEEGIAASIFGPLMFYVYYVFAGPTLNREIFRLDEQFWFIFLHILLMMIAYFAAWNFISSKKFWTKTVGFVIAVSFTSAALYALFVMIRWKSAGIEEETAAKMMTFGFIIIPTTAYIAGSILGVIAERLSKKRFMDVLAAALVPTVIIGFFTKEISTAVFSLIFVFISYYMVHTFKSGFMSDA
ncbi:hypothetical protein HYY70_04035 [Candidatus Woesearchaeota archaeon]|nr:hypothetical protein [Candidatus Woesearchaeota archaeon]